MREKIRKLYTRDFSEKDVKSIFSRLRCSTLRPEQYSKGISV